MAAQEIGSLYVGLGFDTAVFDRQIVQIPQQAQKAAEGIKKGFAGAGQELDKFQKSTGATRAAVQNLTFQLNDIGTSLASGGSPLRVLAQQGGQIIQVFQQGGGVRSVMGAFAVSLRGLITPATGAVAAVAAVAVSIGVLTARAVENSNAMREFSVMLKGLGLEGQATAAGLEEAAKRLKDVGLSASDARTALTAATRAGIAPGLAERVVRTGQNLIPVLGENAPGQLTAAVTGGIEPLGKLAQQFGLITAREMEAAREAAKFGKELSFIERWFGLIEQRSKGQNQAALSPMREAMRKLSIAFSEMLDAASRSSVILGVVDAMTKLAGVLKGVFEMQPPEWFRRIFGLGPNVAATGGGGAALPAGGAGSYHPEAALEMIEHFESGGRNIKNPTSTASGYYQFINSTWREIAPQVGIDINKYPTAMSASRELQMAAATKLYQQRGFQPWTVGNPRLAAYLAGSGGAPGGAGGSVLARPDAAREAFTAARDAETERLRYGTRTEILGEDAAAVAIRARQGAQGQARIAAELEAASRFKGETGSTAARDATAARMRQFFELSQARGRRALAEGGEGDRQQTEQLRLQASLFGKSTEEIEKQVSLLKIRQQAEAAGLPLTEQAVTAREKEATALAEANALLAKQQSLMGQMREIAGVFEGAFSQAFDSIAAGTFKAREFLGSLLRDLGKTLASSAFRRLLGGDSGSGGILGTIAGKLFPSLLGAGATAAIGGGGLGGPLGDFGHLDFNKYASGGSFAVGGSGSIDSQLVAFRASPGEMVQVTPNNQRGSVGNAEVIRIDLNPSEGWVSGVADQRIVTHSGTIVDLAVRQSQKTVARNFAGMNAEAQARQM